MTLPYFIRQKPVIVVGINVGGEDVKRTSVARDQIWLSRHIVERHIAAFWRLRGSQPRPAKDERDPTIAPI